MKSEADMQVQGRKICRAIDNYQPLIDTQPKAQPQTTLNEADK